MTHDELPASYGWLSLRYDQVAKRPGFGAMSVPDQWSRLRVRVLSTYPPNDPGRIAAIDAIDELLHTEILAHLDRAHHPIRE